jgi:hypothetical protein
VGTKCARDEGEKGRKDAATGVSSLSTLQKVFDPFFQLLMSCLALKHMFCNSYWAWGNKDSHAHLDIIFWLHVCELKIVSIVYTSAGRFSLFCENHPVLVLSWCYENLISSLLYIYIFFGAWEPIRLSKRIKLTRFSDKSVLIYTTTTGFHIQFSQPDY